MPPPPDNFPAGWDNEWQPSFENVEIAARSEAFDTASPVRATPKVHNEPVREPRALVSLPVRGTENVFEVEVEHPKREQSEVRHEALAIQPIEASQPNPLTFRRRYMFLLQRRNRTRNIRRNRSWCCCARRVTESAINVASGRSTAR